jgi:spermidine/putrescine transport system ATP-binding protein
MIEMASSRKVLPLGVTQQFDVSVLNRIFMGEHTEYRVMHESMGEFTVLSPRKSESTSGVFEIGDKAVVGWRKQSVQILADT